MSVRSTTFTTTQFGVETTEGTEVNANKQFASMMWKMGMRADPQRYGRIGARFKSLTLQGKLWSEGSIEGGATYDELIVPLASAWSYTAPVQQGATTAYKWTFKPPTSSLPTAHKTYTLEVGDSVRAHLFTGVLCTGFGYSIDRQAFDVSGTLLGRKIDDGITMTSTPTALPLVPIHPSQVLVKVASTRAGLTAADVLEHVYSIEFTSDTLWGPEWTLNSANESYNSHVALQPTMTMTVTIGADSVGMGTFLPLFEAGTTYWIRVEATGATIESTYTYLFTHDFCFQITQPSNDFEDQDGAYAIQWTLDATHDSTLGSATQIELTNTQTTL